MSLLSLFADSKYSLASFDKLFKLSFKAFFIRFKTSTVKSLTLIPIEESNSFGFLYFFAIPQLRTLTSGKIFLKKLSCLTEFLSRA